MAREFPRSRRVEEQIQRILSDVIRAELRDPRLSSVVITAVRVSRDLSVAWVSYATLTVEPAADPAIQAGLDRAAGFLRSRLASQLSTRVVPEVRFRFDEAAERSRHLDSLIDAAVAADNQSRSGPDRNSD